MYHDTTRTSKAMKIGVAAVWTGIGDETTNQPFEDREREI